MITIIPALLEEEAEIQLHCWLRWLGCLAGEREVPCNNPTVAYQLRGSLADRIWARALE